MSREEQLEHDLVVAQYAGLRNEILKHEEVQAQLVTVAVIALGTVMGVSTQSKNPAIALAYPIIALFLARVWSGTEGGVRLIGAYIKVQIELRLLERHANLPDAAAPLLAWETFVHSVRKARHFFYSSTTGIFIVAELIAIAVGAFTLYQQRPKSEVDLIYRLQTHTLVTSDNALFVVLFATDVVCLVATYCTMRYVPNFEEIARLFQPILSPQPAEPERSSVHDRPV